MPSTAKGRNEKGKFRNKHMAFKVKVRRLIPCGPSDDVFDMFAGDGEMFRRCWRAAGRGVTCDLEDSCLAIAAKERQTWTVLKVNVERALRAGIWKDRAFSIIDIDCYGSPWKFLANLFMNRRPLADPCWLVMTDNYMGNRNLSHEDLTLGYRKPGTPEQYLEAVDKLLEKLVVPQGWRHDRKLYRDGKCVQHLVKLSRGLFAGTGG